MGLKVRIDKKDKNRVLLTELLPYEVPMLFGNDNFHRRVLNGTHLYVLEKQTNTRTTKQFTIPYNYDISKGVGQDARTLSIMHPQIQLEFVDFYEKYDTILEYNCQQSFFSLRKIEKIARHSYFSDLVFSEDDTLKSAESEIADDEKGQTAVYKSYFKYDPIDLIYKFYERFDYKRLEQRFTFLMKFDISKCFYNIYTHSISWAVKGKEFAKETINNTTFEGAFDELMRRSNYNETNGIIVGPEISRLFAEIILSKIDREIYEQLSELGYSRSSDYDIRRYVDDYFIYTNDEKLSQEISSILKKSIESFKLYSNDAKHEFHKTPFITKLSIAKHDIKLLVDDFFDAVSEGYRDEESETEKLRIKKSGVHSPIKVAMNFIRDFQYIVRRNDLEYSQLNKDAVRLLASGLRKIIKRHDESNFKSEEYGDFILCFIQCVFYCYSLGMNASSTFKLSRCIVLIHKSMAYMPFSMRENLMLKIISEINNVTNIYLAKTAPGNTNIDIINLIIAMSIFEDRCLLDPGKLMKLFRLNDENRVLNYFEICTLLYYIKDFPQYRKIKSIIMKGVLKLFDVKNAFTYSELTHLFLDLMTCPYIHNASKVKICKRSGYLGIKVRKSDALVEIGKITNDGYWFFNWSSEINLEAVLKKKEWSSVY